jgi:hypothetical protein
MWRRTVQDHIREIIVVLAVRRAIDQATVNAGLLAGLAHPTLYLCLVAVHDDPARQWRTDVLARLAARENAAALPNPTRAAAVFTLLPASRAARPNARRHAVRYAAGIIQTTFVKRVTKWLRRLANSA